MQAHSKDSPPPPPPWGEGRRRAKEKENTKRYDQIFIVKIERSLTAFRETYIAQDNKTLIWFSDSKKQKQKGVGDKTGREKERK